MAAGAYINGEPILSKCSFVVLGSRKNGNNLVVLDVRKRFGLSSGENKHLQHLKKSEGGEKKRGKVSKDLHRQLRFPMFSIGCVFSE